jgi:hypothetical protein
VPVGVYSPFCFAHRAFCVSEMRLRGSGDILRLRFRRVEGAAEEAPSAPATLRTAAAALDGNFPSHALRCRCPLFESLELTSMPRRVK